MQLDRLFKITTIQRNPDFIAGLIVIKLAYVNYILLKVLVIALEDKYTYSYALNSVKTLIITEKNKAFKLHVTTSNLNIQPLPDLPNTRLKFDFT